MMWMCSLFGCGTKDSFEVSTDPEQVPEKEVKVREEPVLVSREGVTENTLRSPVSEWGSNSGFDISTENVRGSTMEIHEASETVVETVEAEVVETTPTPHLHPKLHPLPDSQQLDISIGNPEPVEILNGPKPVENPNLTNVRVEVHNSSCGSLSEGSLGEEVETEGGGGGEHDYEDIYLASQEAGGGHDSGKHSRCPSVSSTNSNLIVHDASTHSPESGMSSASPSDLGHSEEENEKAKLNNLNNHTHSLPHPNNHSRLKRVVSEPGGMGPPPPPPPPPASEENTTPINNNNNNNQVNNNNIINNNNNNNTVNNNMISLPVKHEPAPPALLHNIQRSSSNTSGTTEVERGMNGGNQQQQGGSHVGHLVNKQMVLPFIVPKFSSADPNALIKPSEYLRSLSGGSNQGAGGGPGEGGGGGSEGGNSPPVAPPPPGAPAPPPPPPPPAQEPNKHQPLSTISIHDLHSVQLRRTKQPALKTMSCPPRSLSGVVEQPFQAQKEDLIAELKKSKNIGDIKKMKVERVKNEEKHEKELVLELSKQFSIEHFVHQMPDKDSAGNPIPPWKRQMLAKKAADKARKEKEYQIAKEAEEKRLQAIPAWKRNLMLSKKGDENVDLSRNGVIPVAPPPPPPAPAPVVMEEKKVVVVETAEDKENSKPGSKHHEESDEETSAQIIPWRAQLRKTNSTLNLLE